MRLPGPGQTTNGSHAASIAPVMSFTEIGPESDGSKVVGKVKRADGQCIHRTSSDLRFATIDPNSSLKRAAETCYT
jgi:hypothetical protein